MVPSCIATAPYDVSWSVTEVRTDVTDSRRYAAIRGDVVATTDNTWDIHCDMLSMQIGVVEVEVKAKQYNSNSVPDAPKFCQTQTGHYKRIHLN